MTRESQQVLIGQMYNNEIRIFAAFLTEAMSLKRHIEECVKPWLSTNLSSLPKTPNAPKLRLLGAYEDDPQGKSDTHRTVREALPAEWCSISKPWESRRDAMLEVLVKAQAFSFKPVVQINSTDTQVLSQALNGRVSRRAKSRRKPIESLTRSACWLPGWRCGKQCHRTPSRRDSRQARWRLKSYSIAVGDSDADRGSHHVRRKRCRVSGWLQNRHMCDVFVARD